MILKSSASSWRRVVFAVVTLLLNVIAPLDESAGSRLLAADPPEVAGARLEENGKWLEAAQLYRDLALAGNTIGPGWVQRALVAYLTADRAQEAEEA